MDIYAYIVFGTLLVISFVIGIAIGIHRTYKSNIGTIKQVLDEDGNYLFLEMNDEGPKTLIHSEYVVFKVDEKSFSQK